MAEKAILITNANVEKLNARFQHEGTGVPAAVGYYLVAGFGEDGDYSIMSSSKFHQQYIEGKPIRNGFFEAIRKREVSVG